MKPLSEKKIDSMSFIKSVVLFLVHKDMHLNVTTFNI